MLKFSKAKVISACFVFCIIWFIWPVYEYFAYKGKVGFPPYYQFIEIPDNNPTDQNLYLETYRNEGNSALELLTFHKKKINAPAISAAVSIDGQLVWAGVSGWSDIENKTSATINTQFRVGSTSKALTGTALARMVDEKLIELDKPISTYMNDIPNQWRNITARQLASHTSGLPHYKHNTDYFGLYKTVTLSTRYETVESSLTIFDDSDLLFTPGSKFSYSTLGTVLLSAVMKNAANKPYLDIMQEEVFGPLNMNATMAEFEGENLKNLATFYWNDKGRSSQVRKWRNVDLSHRLAGGGFISTSSDLVTMGNAFLNNDFILPKTRKIFWTPQILPDGSETPDGYSLGWRFLKIKINDELGDISVANHGGVSRGAQSWLMVIPEHNMSIAVNINSNTDNFWSFGKVSLELAKMFILAKKEQAKLVLN
ncbi:MAG: serine beta-lactamase-like protein LACTB [Colwellia sp.]|jgi:serine beta-lactamase-like protein LACTB